MDLWDHEQVIAAAAPDRRTLSGHTAKVIDTYGRAMDGRLSVGTLGGHRQVTHTDRTVVD